MNKDAYSKARLRADEPEEGWPDAFGVVTACNPDGKLLTKWENQVRTGRLEVALMEAGLALFPVTGYDEGSPHEEVGFGVVCGKEEIVRLGKEWDQEAVFWVEAGEVWLLSCAPAGEEFRLRPFQEMLWQRPCPCCGKGMQMGTAGLEYTFWGWFWAGWSSLTLFFRNGKGKRVKVMGPDRGRHALFCNSCGALLLKSLPAEHEIVD